MELLNEILRLPERCMTGKKIPKTFFKRNFDLTSAERALLDDPARIIGIEWIASISPGSSNINVYRDEEYIYEEVQVISVQTTASDFEKNQYKITELVQKYIPYPILLCIWYNHTFVLNACDKKVNQNDSNRRTIGKRHTTEIVNYPNLTGQQQAFLDSLNFRELDKTSLKTFYEAYIQRLIALQTADLSGMFVLRTQHRTQDDLVHLEKIATLEKEIQLLHYEAKKESQLNQRVAINTLIHEKRTQIEALKALITV